MSSRFAGGSSSHSRIPFEQSYVNDFFNNDLPPHLQSSTLPNRKSRSELKNKFATDPRPSSAGRRNFAENTRSFSPSVRRSGEDILSRLKNQLQKDSGMFSRSSDWNSEPFRMADDSEDWARKSFEDMRSRQPGFRMPNWMGEDDDVSNLTSRMSQAPHFATMGGRSAGRGGPWRERRNSGGSAMSGTSEDDSVDSSHRQEQPTPVTIPIRIEAEAPPGTMPTLVNQGNVPRGTSQSKINDPSSSSPKQHEQSMAEAPQMGQLRKQPHYASRTSPAVDALSQEQVARDTRCASAPPDMSGPLNAHNKFTSKTKVTPQNSNGHLPVNSSPVFNNVPKPYVSSKPSSTFSAPIQEELPSDPKKFCNMEQSFNPEPHHYQQENVPQHTQYSEPQQQWGGHKSSVVRTIPIIVEGRDEGFVKNRTPPPQPPIQQQQQQQPRDQPQRDHSSPGQSHWEQPQRQQYWEQFQRPQWDHGFGSPSSFGFSPDPFFDHSQSPRSNFQQPQSNPSDYRAQQPFQRQPSPPKETVKRQTSPPKESTRQPSPPKETQQIPVQPIKNIKLEKIAKVRSSIDEFFERAKNFKGLKTDKEYLYIDEMLTRALIQLDNIEPEGQDDIRQARRALIKDINDTLTQMEQTASEVVPPVTVSGNPTDSNNEPNNKSLASSDTKPSSSSETTSVQPNDSASPQSSEMLNTDVNHPSKEQDDKPQEMDSSPTLSPEKPETQEEACAKIKENETKS